MKTFVLEVNDGDESWVVCVVIAVDHDTAATMLGGRVEQAEDASRDFISGEGTWDILNALKGWEEGQKVPFWSASIPTPFLLTQVPALRAPTP